MCGFPCDVVSKHLKLLLKNNLTVAIYNQDKVKSKNKDHELFGIFSPSTYIDEENFIDNNIKIKFIEHITFNYIFIIIHY